jgi:hypothetical protein
MILWSFNPICYFCVQAVEVFLTVERKECDTTQPDAN